MLVGERPLAQAVKSFERADPITLPFISPESKFDPGNLIGRLLFLMYINDLPNCLRVAAPRMFADDTSITLSAKTVADLKLAVTSELNNLTCWLRANKLSLNVAKTELMIIGSRQRLNAQCEEIDISIDDRTIKRVDHTKSPGLTIDAQLSCKVNTLTR